MTLQKEIAELYRDNRLVIATSGIISVKRLSAQNPSYFQIGPTIGGIEIQNICEQGFFGDDGTTGPIGSLVLSEEIHLKFALSQAGIYNLALAINANPDGLTVTQPIPDPQSDGVVSLEFGGRRDCELYEIKAQIMKPSELVIREYVFFKAIPTPRINVIYLDGQITAYECSFRLLMDTSRNEGKRYFSITDYYDSDYGELSVPNV